MDDAKDVDHDGEVSSLPSRACVNREERIVDYKRSAGMLIFNTGGEETPDGGFESSEEDGTEDSLRRGIPSLCKSGKTAVVRPD